MSGVFLPAYALPVYILLSVLYIFSSNSCLYFTTYFACFQLLLLYLAKLLQGLAISDVQCGWVDHDELQLHLAGRFVDTRKFLKSLEISSIFSYNEIKNTICGRAWLVGASYTPKMGVQALST